jgi:hypothetical protein
VGRDDDIEAIVALGRQTRTPSPRWLWIAAGVVGVVCACGFAVMMLGGGEPTGAAPGSRTGARPDPRPDPRIDGRPTTGPGLGIGLAIGLGVGIVIGFSIGRQRRDHSSRNSP